MLENSPLIESDEKFEQKMERGYADALADRGKPLDEVFDKLRERCSNFGSLKNRVDDLKQGRNCAEHELNEI